MAAFKFKCSKCGKHFMKLLPDKVKAYPCECGAEAEAQMSSTSSSLIYDTRDRYHGKKLRRGIEGQLKDRSTDHHDHYELAEKIDKYGMDDATKHNWLKKIKRN